MGKKEVASIVWSYPMVPIGEKLLNVEPRESRPFIMSSETRRGSPLKIIIGIALVGVIGLGAGYYFTFGLVDRQVVQWSVSPIQIKFSTSQSYSGSVQDSFTCDPSVSPVTLQAISSQPDKITITVSPTSFPTCGSTPDSVTITASCTPAAIANGTCPGDHYTGTVVVCGPSSYTCLKQKLTVNVAVTTKPS